MPSDTPLRRRRAPRAVSATALVLSLLAADVATDVAPAGAAGATGATDVAGADEPTTTMTALTRLVAARSAAVTASANVVPAVRSDVPAIAADPAEIGASDEYFELGAESVRSGPPAAPAAAPSPTPAPDPRELIAAGCPDLDDARLLRDGADADGHGLCVRSVHAARSDTAAAAVVEGFGLLGLPYSRSRRGKDGYDDCSSFVGRAYRDAGRPLSDSDWEPSSSVMRNASWAAVVDEPLPGDILWRRGHVAMALTDGFMMHASQSGDVTHVRRAGRYRSVLAVDASV